MGRQRTVDDANFWRSPRIADCTQEDKATLLYLLTSPSSNVVGVYPIVPRVSAAEMGWTADQLLPVLQRLSERDLIGFDAASSYVWVRLWWDHNSARMALGQKLREKSLAQISAIPDCWRPDYVRDLHARLPFELQHHVCRYLSTGEGAQESTPTTLSIPYPSADTLSSRVSYGSGVNINSTVNLTKTLTDARDGQGRSTAAEFAMQALRAMTRAQ